MSIADLREEMNDTGSKLTMRYEQGGRVQVYAIGDVEVRVPPATSHDDIKDALADEMVRVKKAKADALILPNPFVTPDA
jgi:hypothetical protein